MAEIIAIAVLADANLYVNVCIFVIISYAMRYPVKAIFRKPKAYKYSANNCRVKQVSHRKTA